MTHTHRAFLGCLVALSGAVYACSDGKETPKDQVDGGVTVDSGLVPDARSIHEPEAPWYPCSEDDLPPGATVVVAHNRADQYFAGGEPGQNLRVVDASGDFPAQGAWRRVFLRVELECPADGQCDAWDRGATISLVEKEGEKELPIELVRHMTPYRLGLCFVADVTDFASRLVGKKTIRSFIDTWVGPGHNSGHGWRMTTKFVFHPGVFDRAAYASEVIPLWNNAAEDRLVEVGDPNQSLADALPPRTVKIPDDATGVKLRYLITGHGQGNLNNCAEFCSLWHTTTFANSSAKVAPWRSDCDSNPLNKQAGSWQYNRAGWCPGSMVAPQLIDITKADLQGGEIVFAHSVANAAETPYVNTCRPGAGNTQNVCQGCVFNSSAGNCDYDSNGHTSPYARLSVQLLVYRP
jgi:hypothetical protein